MGGAKRGRNRADRRNKNLLVGARRISDRKRRCLRIETVRKRNLRQFGERPFWHVNDGRHRAVGNCTPIDVSGQVPAPIVGRDELQTASVIAVRQRDLEARGGPLCRSDARNDAQRHASILARGNFFARPAEDQWIARF